MNLLSPLANIQYSASVADVAQMVEQLHGKEQVAGSIPAIGSRVIGKTQPRTPIIYLLWYDVRMVNAKKPRNPCPNCGKEPRRAYYKYCSNKCQRECEHLMHIEKWKRGEVSGLSTIGTVSSNVKRYLRKKFGNKCCLCGWSKTNLNTNQVPLVADHIDGNWRNNDERNLRLLCPNCDSLTSTYAGLNRGNGRVGRVVSKRAKEGRLLMKGSK